MKKVDFDNYTSNYNQLLHQRTRLFSSDEAYFARYKVQILSERIQREPRRVLEFGCGIGRNIPFLCETFRSAEIMGSDISAISLEIARTKNPGIYFWREGDVAAAQRNFDLILVAGVFHHIPTSERVAVARLLFSRLVSDGLVFVFEHNPYNPVTRRIVSNCPYDEDAVLLRPETGRIEGSIMAGRVTSERTEVFAFLSTVAQSSLALGAVSRLATTWWAVLDAGA